MIAFSVDMLNLDHSTPIQADVNSLNKVGTNIDMNQLMEDNSVQNLNCKQTVHFKNDFTRTQILGHPKHPPTCPVRQNTY